MFLVSIINYSGLPIDDSSGDTMMTSSNGNIFRVTGALRGELIGHRWILHTKASDAELWCFLHLYKRLSKQPWGWWFETPSCLLWRHCNDADGSSLVQRFSWPFYVELCWRNINAHCVLYFIANYRTYPQTLTEMTDNVIFTPKRQGNYRLHSWSRYHYVVRYELLIARAIV